MSDLAIRVENIGKRYRLGATSTMDRTFREVITEGIRGTFSAKRASDDGRDEALDAKSVWALRDVSFDVKPGEVVGIVGRNGSGKSTLLKLLSRIMDPSEGRATIRGRVGSLLEVGTGFHPELTGCENIFLNGAILGMTRREVKRKFDEIVGFAEIAKFIDTPVKRYSSGMYVRLAFAVAAHLEPEILIVDEVLAVGDLAFQKKCLGKMKDVSCHGRTVLFVSHNMAAVTALCSRAILLQEGQCKLDDTPSEVVGTYLSGLDRAASIPLREREDREGDGVARCIDLWLEDMQGNRVDRAMTGHEVRICMAYESTEPGRCFDFALGIYDHTGTCILHNGTRFNPFAAKEDQPATGVAVCRIPNLPLPAAEYRLNTSITHDGVRSDRLEGAASLTVEPGDFFGSGKTPTSAYAKALADHGWSIRGIDLDESKSADVASSDTLSSI